MTPLMRPQKFPDTLGSLEGNTEGVYCKQRCLELPRGLPAGDHEEEAEEAGAAVNPQSPQTSDRKGSDRRREE